jgi:Uma2 family endonuclease
MSAPNHSRVLTVEDLYARPEDGFRYELQAGLLLAEPLPGFRHGRVMAAMAALLREHVHKLQLGIVVAGDAGFILWRKPDTVRGPDVAFVSRARIDERDDGIRAFAGAPDLAIEIVSPSNSSAEVRSKVADYLAAGARCVWVVDIEARSVTTYEALLSPRLLREADVLDAGDVVPGFSVRVGEIFEI